MNSIIKDTYLKLLMFFLSNPYIFNVIGFSITFMCNILSKTTNIKVIKTKNIRNRFKND